MRNNYGEGIFYCDNIIHLYGIAPSGLVIAKCGQYYNRYYSEIGGMTI